MIESCPLCPMTQEEFERLQRKLKERVSDMAVKYFNSESWLVIYSHPDSEQVEFATGYHTKDEAVVIADWWQGLGGHVYHIVKTGELMAALQLAERGKRRVDRIAANILYGPDGPPKGGE